MKWNKDNITIYFDVKAIRTQKNTYHYKPLNVFFDMEAFGWHGLPEVNELPVHYYVDFLRV